MFIPTESYSAEKFKKQNRSLPYFILEIFYYKVFYYLTWIEIISQTFIKAEQWAVCRFADIYYFAS